LSESLENNLRGSRINENGILSNRSHDSVSMVTEIGEPKDVSRMLQRYQWWTSCQKLSKVLGYFSMLSVLWFLVVTIAES